MYLLLRNQAETHPTGTIWETNLVHSLGVVKAAGLVTLLQMLSFSRLPGHTLHPERGLLSSITLAFNVMLLRTGWGILVHPTDTVNAMAPSLSLDEMPLLQRLVLLVGCHEATVQIWMLASLWTGAPTLLFSFEL